MQQVVDRARIPLNDDKTAGSDAQCRTTDAELLGYANDGLLILQLQRPDMFFGQFEGLPGTKALADPMPIPDMYFPALCDYVTARAETPDDEAVVQARATLFFGLFGQQEGAG